MSLFWTRNVWKDDMRWTQLAGQLLSKKLSSQLGPSQAIACFQFFLYAKILLIRYDFGIIPHGIKPHVKATGSGSWHVFLGNLVDCQRVVCLVDGLNLYHAISALDRPEFKWVDLRNLAQVFLKSNSEELSGVFYFSAYAEHVSEFSLSKRKIREWSEKGNYPEFPDSSK